MSLPKLVALLSAGALAATFALGAIAPRGEGAAVVVR